MRDPFDWLLFVFAAFVMFMWFITTPVKAEEVRKYDQQISYCWAKKHGFWLPCRYSRKVYKV